MRNRLLLLVAALAGGLLGCGGDDDGGGPPPLGGPSNTANLTIACSALGVYDIDVPATLTGTLETDPTTGATMLAQVVGSITLTAATGDIILAVGAGQDTVTLEDLTVTLNVTGATPTTVELSIADLPRDIDFDANDDGAAEAIIVESDVAETSITLDASGSLDLTLAGATVNMSNVPTLGTLDLVVPSTGGTVECALPDPNTPIHFDVL